MTESYVLVRGQGVGCVAPATARGFKKLRSLEKKGQFVSVKEHNLPHLCLLFFIDFHIDPSP